MLKGKVTAFLSLLIFVTNIIGQTSELNDTMPISKYLTLDSVVISDMRKGFDVNAFIRLVENDTTFYQAFQNLRMTEYESTVSMNFFNKYGNKKATYYSSVNQKRQNGCRWMQFLNEQSTGNFYDNKSEYEYYTAQLFAYIFLNRDTVCNAIETSEASYNKGLENRKNQLKMIMFNPGKEVDGIPFIRNKTAVFDFQVMRHYDFFISSEEYNGADCYVFSFQLNEESKPKDVVVQKMTTWFDKTNFQILARDYHLQYDAGVYDFDVTMHVELFMKNSQYLPAVLLYSGTWNVPGKPRETAGVNVFLH